METLANQMGDLSGGDETVTIVSGRNPRYLAHFGGHSNCVGRANVADVDVFSGLADQQRNVRLAQRLSKVPWTGYEDTFGFLEPRTPTTMVPYDFGTELSAGRWIADAHRFAISKFGVSGANLISDWLVSGFMEDEFSFVDAQIISLRAELGVWIGFHDANDATGSIAADAFYDNLIDYIDRVQTKYPGVPIILTKLPSTCTQTYASTVRAAQDDVEALAIANVFFVNTDPIGDVANYDGLHWTANGYFKLGKLIALKIFIVLNLSAPADPMPGPVSTDKTVYTQTENIIISWSGLANPTDFVGISTYGSPTASFNDIWAYTNGTQTAPGAVVPAGSATFTPTVDGTWGGAGGVFVARSWANDSLDNFIAESAPFTILPEEI